MCAFQGGFGEEDAVVGDDADGVVVDAREACHERFPIILLEFGELTAVDDAGDDFAGGDLLSKVGAYDAAEFFGIVEGLFERCRGL